MGTGIPARDRRRQERRITGDRRSVHDRRKSTLLRVATGLWSTYHQQTSLEIKERFELGSQEVLFEALRQEAKKYRFFDSRGGECTYSTVISTAVTELKRSIREGITVGEVICQIVAILDVYEPTVIERRSQVDRRWRDRRLS
jgi:hypothetical protein